MRQDNKLTDSLAKSGTFLAQRKIKINDKKFLNPSHNIMIKKLKINGERHVSLGWKSCHARGIANQGGTNGVVKLMSMLLLH